MDKAKPFCIAKRDVWEAYKQVKANRGAAGVHGQSIEDFDGDLSKNLYRIWNRMCSGSYFPSPVRRVDIPKGDSGKDPAAWHSNGLRQNRPEGRQTIPGTNPGTQI
jgi:retron-type reverse transcriptase